MTEKVGGIEFDVNVDASGVVIAETQIEKSAKAIERAFNKTEKDAEKLANTIQREKNKEARAAENAALEVEKAARRQIAAEKMAADQITKSANRKAWALGQSGNQVADFAVQVEMGTDPIRAFTQQGSQMAAMFGPTGMVIGALGAVAGAIISSLLPALMKSTDHVDDLEKAMESLRNTAKKGSDGIFDFTETLKEMSKVGVSVIGAEIEASLIRAEKAAESAAKGISEKLGELDADYGFSSINTMVTALNNVNKSSNVNIQSGKAWLEITTELGEQFGKTGDDAQKFGDSIITALAELEKTPTPEKFEQLQNKLSAAALSGDKVSESAKLMVSDLKLFFAEARASGETADFLRQQLAKLNKEGSVDLDIKETNTQLTASDELVVKLGQQLQIAKSELEGNKLQATELATAFALGLDSSEKLPESAKLLLAELLKVDEQQQLNAKNEREAIKAKTDAERDAAKSKADLEKEYAKVDQSNTSFGKSEDQLLKDKFQAEMDVENEYNLLKLEQAAGNHALIEEEKQRHANSLTAITARQNAAEETLEESKAKAKMAIVGGIFKDLSSLMNTESKKMFEIGKAAAIAGALVDAYAAVTGAYKVGSTLGGPILGAAYAAAAGVAQAVNIQNIAKQKIGGAKNMGATQSFSGGTPTQNTSTQTTQNVDVYLSGDNFSRSGIAGLVSTLNEYFSDGGTTLNVKG